MAAFMPLFVPFSVVRGWLDAYSGDGSADPFTPLLYGRLRLCSAAIAAACGLFAAILYLLRGTVDRCFDELRSDWQSTVTPMAREIRSNAVWLMVVTVCGIAVRLPGLSQPLRFDEATSWIYYASRPWFVTLSRYDDPNNHIFHNLLMNISARCFGSEEWSLRLPAFLFGCILVPLTGLLGLTCARNRLAGVLASLIVAGSSTLIEYSTLGRGYSIVCCCTIGLWLLVIPASFGRSTWAWMGIVILTVLGAWTIPVMLYPAIAVWSWLFFALFLGCEGESEIKWRWKQFFTAVAATLLFTVLCYSPVLIVSGPQSITANSFVVPMPLAAWCAGLPEACQQVFDLLARDWNGSRWLLIVPLCLGLVAIGPKSGHGGFRRLAVATTLISFFVTMLQRVYPPGRVWLYLLPLIAVLIACGTTKLLERFRDSSTVRRLSWLGAFMLLTCWPTWNAIRHDAWGLSCETGVAPRCADAVSFCKSQLKNGEALIACCPTSSPLKYYAHRFGFDPVHFDMPFSENIRKDSVVVVTAHDHCFQQTAADVIQSIGFTDALRGWKETTIGELPGITIVRLERPSD